MNRRDAVCKICERECVNFRGRSAHIKTHGLTSKEYYDRFYKSEAEGICKRFGCGKETEFRVDGYNIYCSRRCGVIDSLEKRQRTCLDRYGVNWVFQLERIVEKATKNIITYNKSEKHKEDNKKGVITFREQNPEGFLRRCRLGGLSIAKRNRFDWPFFNTKPEIEMKRCLKELGIHYEFQYPVKNIEHCYIADFYLPLYNLIIEVDGDTHPNKKDEVRTKEMEETGYRLLRFKNGEFDAEKVWREI
jgi:very-short-patch-repair endonuclease